MILGDFKQVVARLHNETNQDIFGQGLQWQKVEVLQDKVVIIAKNRRVQAISAIDEKDSYTARLMDIALLVEFKKRFKLALSRDMGLNVTAVLKDYDPGTETSICILLLARDLTEILDGLEEH